VADADRANVSTDSVTDAVEDHAPPVSPPTGRQRLFAVAAFALAAASVVFAVVAAIEHFPRGLFEILLIVAAIFVAWHGVLRRGVVSWILLGVAVLLAAAAIVLLVDRSLVLTLLVVICAVAAVAAARAALIRSTTLPPAPRPGQPVLIFNPKSGGGKATRFHLADEARRRGIEPHEMPLGVPLQDTVEELLAQGADALAVAGGDGTQAIVAAIAAREKLPYACIPAGTRNHFALDLGVDRDDVVGALDAFVDGGERIVDLAEVNGRVFVNNVSLGVYADAVQRPGYRDAKLRTIANILPESVEEESEGTPLRWRDPDGFQHDSGLALLVSNNAYRLGNLIGSGTRPRLDAGRLGVAVIQPKGALGRGLVRNWTLGSIEVDGPGSIPAGIDGEAVVLTSPLRFEVRPGALRVRIAKQHPGCSPSAGMPGGAWSGVRQLAGVALGESA
jgi:diacylglycerol kinase family enzyme